MLIENGIADGIDFFHMDRAAAFSLADAVPWTEKLTMNGGVRSGRHAGRKRGERESMGAAAVGGRMKILPLDAWLLPRGGSRKKLWTLAHTRSALETVFGDDSTWREYARLPTGWPAC